MNKQHTTSFKIGGLTFLCGLVFFIVALYWYQDFTSMRHFLGEFFIGKNIYMLLVIGVFSGVIGIVSSYFISDIFSKIEEHNKKLKDYNHYLAHELKTPISIMYSNLDVLRYGYDSKIVEKSRRELKNMIHIIDGLLNFSDSMSVSEKKHINLENFLHSFSMKLENKDDIKIFNKEFNYSIETDELLFGRVVKNIIDNALKYSSDGKVEIYITQEKLVFQNTIGEKLSKGDIRSYKEKSFAKSFEEKKGHGIGLPMLQEIVKELGYEMKIFSKDYKFIVEIYFTT